MKLSRVGKGKELLAEWPEVLREQTLSAVLNWGEGSLPVGLPLLRKSLQSPARERLKGQAGLNQNSSSMRTGVSGRGLSTQYPRNTLRQRFECISLFGR